MTRPIRSPRIDALHLPDLDEGNADLLGPGQASELTRYDGADLSGRDLSGAEFLECAFINVAAHEANLRAARFQQVLLDGLNAPALSAPRSEFRDVRITASRIGAAEFHDARLEATIVEGCKLDWVNLRSAELVDVEFRDCTITELDLAGARATRVAFAGCRVDTIRFTRTTLTDVDLRGLEVGRIEDLAGMSGATVSTTQATLLAPLLAAQLGIRIAEG